MRRNKNSAFTLLEVLIALGLVATLMVLCWQLFATFSRLETRSRKMTSGLEIVRSLRRQLQNDLDQLILRPAQSPEKIKPPSLEDELTKLSSQGLLSGQQVEAPNPGALRDSNVESLPGSSQSGSSFENDLPLGMLFQGTSDSLAFLIPNNQQNFGSQLKGQPVVVVYEWTETKNVQTDEAEPITENGDENQELNVESNQKRIFTRRVLSQSAYQQELQQADGESDELLLKNVETIVIGDAKGIASEEDVELEQQMDSLPEIGEISFRYFDGNSWQNSFSASSGSLPIALEVVWKPVEIKSDTRREMDDPESELDDELEMEIGNEDDEVFAFESEDAFAASGRFGFEPIDPESKRFVIRLGSQMPRSNSLSSESADFLDFESSSGGIE